MRDERPYLMLAEEDDLLAEIISFRLELLGYRVERMKGGLELLEQTRRDLPDLIIVDLFLPDISGFDLINQLSSETQTDPVPILVFSTDSELESVEKAYAAGADDFLVVPFDPTVMESKVEELLERATEGK